MKKNIIFSWADATWKTTRAENLANQWYNLSILKKEIDILRFSIKQNIEIAISQWLNNDKIVMDRSLIDLLAYYYINDKNWLVDKNNWIWSIHWIKKILEEFIVINKWSVFNYLVASKEVIIERLKNREKQWEKLTENDLKVINKEGYLEEFILAFNKIIKIFEKINKKKWNLIDIKKIDTTNLVLDL